MNNEQPKPARPVAEIVQEIEQRVNNMVHRATIIDATIRTLRAQKQEIIDDLASSRDLLNEILARDNGDVNEKN